MPLLGSAYLGGAQIFRKSPPPPVVLMQMGHTTLQETLQEMLAWIKQLWESAPITQQCTAMH